MLTASTLTYDFNKTYFENFYNARLKEMNSSGDFYRMFYDSWDAKDSNITVDGVAVNNGIDIKDYVQRIYNGQTPKCMLDQMAYDIGAALGGLGDFGCALGKAIYDIINAFTDIFGTFICTATVENLGKECGAEFLATLKDYRDATMTDREGILMLGYYRDIGPQLVEAINKDPDREAVYSYLWTDYIVQLPDIIESGNKHKVLTIYLAMIDEMADRYGIETTDRFKLWKQKYEL